MEAFEYVRVYHVFICGGMWRNHSIIVLFGGFLLLILFYAAIRPHYHTHTYSEMHPTFARAAGCHKHIYLHHQSVDAFGPKPYEMISNLSARNNKLCESVSLCAHTRTSFAASPSPAIFFDGKHASGNDAGPAGSALVGLADGCCLAWLLATFKSTDSVIAHTVQCARCPFAASGVPVRPDIIHAPFSVGDVRRIGRCRR